MSREGGGSKGGKLGPPPRQWASQTEWGPWRSLTWRVVARTCKRRAVPRAVEPVFFVFVCVDRNHERFARIQ